MDIKEFIKRDRDLFKWSEVEVRAKIPNSSLRSFVSGRRELSDDVFRSVRDFFVNYGIELEYARPKSNKSRKRAIQVGDIVSTNGWRLLLRGIYKKDNMLGVLENGNIRITKIT